MKTRIRCTRCGATLDAVTRCPCPGRLQVTARGVDLDYDGFRERGISARELREGLTRDREADPLNYEGGA